MTNTMQIGDRTLSADNIIPLLTHYQLLPRLMQETIIDNAIAPFSCTVEETNIACEQFYAAHQLETESDRQNWLTRYGMTPEQVELATTRQLRIQKFKQTTWGLKLESYFLKRKNQLDRAIYSLIRTKEMGLANELYFRIQEGEQSFSELAQQFSEGSEAATGGLVGPVEIGTLHRTMAGLLRTSRPGELRSPTPVDQWMVIVRLEKIVPARFDQPMKQRLLDELFSHWLQEQLRQLPEADQRWLGLVRPDATETHAA